MAKTLYLCALAMLIAVVAASPASNRQTLEKVKYVKLASSSSPGVHEWVDGTPLDDGNSTTGDGDDDVNIDDAKEVIINKPIQINIINIRSGDGKGVLVNEPVQESQIDLGKLVGNGENASKVVLINKPKSVETINRTSDE